jgi:hypothetical protein
MISTTVTPPRAGKATCTECWMTAHSPIVVEISHGKGRCADRKACEIRKRRAANRAKASR